MQKTKIWGIVNLNENGEDNNSLIRYFDDNGALPDGNFNEITGQWLIIEGQVEVNDKLIYAYRNIDNTTLIKIEEVN